MKIGVFTGNRAEYGLLSPLITAIEDAADMHLVLFVGGALLNEKYGETLSDIEAGGIPIAQKIHILEPGVNGVTTAGAISDAITECEKAFLKEDLDGIFVYADRYEGFAAIIAASHSNIPVLHIEGGDLTNGGAFDDNVRHSMTKLSHLHFPSNDNAVDIILRLGEEPWRVCKVGLLPFSDYQTKDYADIDELTQSLGFELQTNIVLFTLHSISSSLRQTAEEAAAAFSAIEKIAKRPETSVIVTFPNDDNGSEIIISYIEMLRRNNTDVLIFPSLGQRRYYGILNLQSLGFNVACMGNTSSIVKECVFFNVTGVLIGTRQDGRLTPANVKKVPAKVGDILASYDNEDVTTEIVENPYLVTDGVDRALEHVRRNLRNPNILRKKFIL